MPISPNLTGPQMDGQMDSAMSRQGRRLVEAVKRDHFQNPENTHKMHEGECNLR